MPIDFTSYQTVAFKTLLSAADNTKQELPALISSYRVTPDSSNLFTTPGSIRALATYLKKSTYGQFRTLTDIAVTDRLATGARFTANFGLLSTAVSQRLTISLSVDETESIPTLTGNTYQNTQAVFPAADWMEREVWDMFGIHFTGHADLRRILTDYGYRGHPLRKDHPLSGFDEVSYDTTCGRVVSSPIELAQEFRVFTVKQALGRTTPHA